MKENKVFRITFIAKKQKADRLYIEFSWNLNAKYTEVPQSSIVMHPFLMFHIFQKCLDPRLEPINGFKQCCLPQPLTFKNSLKAKINIY